MSVPTSQCRAISITLSLALLLFAPAAATALAQQVTPASRDPQAQVLRGRQLLMNHGCADCHAKGNDPGNPLWMAGALDSLPYTLGPFVTLPQNLTPDAATGIGRYTDRQIFNAVRYGLKPSATPDVTITSSVPGQGNHPVAPQYLSPAMPWPAFRHIPNDDLLAIIAYLRHGVKPVQRAIPASTSPPDRWASEYGPDRIGPYPAHAYPTANETGDRDAQVLRGRALVVEHGCGDCHGGIDNPASGDWLQGSKGKGPLAEFNIGPFKTRPRNLTPDNLTGLGRFSERQIFNSLRYGLRPGETPDVEITSHTPGQGNFPVAPKYLAPPMPWPFFRFRSDDDLRAIAAYLKRGLKPVRHRVLDSEGPPDFWAETYAPVKTQYPAPPFPAASERRP